jgi:thiamine pyrophosphate-dependent acetolactate synthase large subunit-like protein
MKMQPQDSQRGPAISCEQALEALAAMRAENQIVIANQMSARVWPNTSQHPLDLNYLSSTMGGAVPLGLGIAIARPDCEVIVLSGDVSLLMNLGCLVSVTASGVTNLTVILLDNGIYEVTGGQQTPGWQSQIDYAALARASGFRNVESFVQLDDWRGFLKSAWQRTGPSFFALRVHPVQTDTPRCTTTQVDQELQRLRTTLQSWRAVGR